MIFKSTICSKILQRLLVKEIGLLFEGLYLLTLLCTGTTYEIFNLLGIKDKARE